MSRMSSLESFYVSFKETGVYLLDKTSCGYGFPASADDLGYVFYTTLLASIFNIAPLQAACTFFYGLFLLSLFMIAGSFLALSSSFLECLLTVLLLARLAMPFIYLNHVYIGYFLGVAPIATLLWAERASKIACLRAVFFTAGMCAAAAHNIRILSALPMIVFYSIWLLFVPHKNIKIKAILLLFFIVGYAIPYAHYHYHLQQRNRFLKEQRIDVSHNLQKHVFWHNIYTGLGFLSNQEGITWLDSCAAKRALEINPDAKYPSYLYEKTIRDEIFRLCKERRYFVITTVFAKLGVAFYFFIIYCGLLGLFLSWLYPKPLYVELAFWAALAISVLPGIVTLPVTAYLIGFITITILYVIYSSLHALKFGLYDDVKKIISSKRKGDGA